MVYGYADTANTRRSTECASSEDLHKRFLQTRIEALEKELKKYQDIKSIPIQICDKNGKILYESDSAHVLLRMKENQLSDIQIFEK